MSSSDLKKKFTEMKVGDLRQELGKLGLEKTGIKAVLVERLVEYYDPGNKSNGSENFTETMIIETDEGDDGADGEADCDGDGEGDADCDADRTLTLDGEGVVVSVMEEDEVLQEEVVQVTETDLGNQQSELEEAETQQIVEEEGEEEEEEEIEEMDEDEEEGTEEQQIEISLETTTQVVEDEKKQEEDEEQGTVGDVETSAKDLKAKDVEERSDVEEVDASGGTGDVEVEKEKEQEENAKVMEQGTSEQVKDEQVAVVDRQIEQKEPASNNTSEISKDDLSQDNKVDEAATPQAVSHSTTSGKSLIVLNDREDDKDGDRHLMLVTGLSSTTTANDLKTYFRKHGKIGRIKLMINTKGPESLRFAHISVNSLEELQKLVKEHDGVKIKGTNIRLTKAPDDGSIASSYEIVVATQRAHEGAGGRAEPGGKIENGKAAVETGEGKADVMIIDEKKDSVEKGAGDDVQVIQDSASPTKKMPEKKEETSEGKKPEDKKDKSNKKSTDKVRTTSSKTSHRSRKESHEKNRRVEGFRPQNRGFRRDLRDKNPVSMEWRRHGPPPRGPMEITRVQRDRPPMGRGHPHPDLAGGRRRSPHEAQLTFEQIRDIRNEQRRRDVERRKREEERERAAELDRQKRLEYQNYMEFKQIEKEREKLRLERERIEKEKLELFKLERERQKAERERIEKEKEELRRAKMNIEHSHHRQVGIKRPYVEEKDRRREPEPRKKQYVTVERTRSDSKTEAERKMERDRYDRISTARPAETRARSPERVSREVVRDPWARGERAPDPRSSSRTLSDERIHRRESETLKVSSRSREAPSRAATGSSELMSRYAMEPLHASSSRSASSTTKRPVDRYDDVRSSTREAEWVQRSSYMSASSALSMPMSSSTAQSRDNWSMPERKVEAWDTSRLAPRTEQWITGAGSAGVAGTGRSLPVIPPPPPIYSHAAAGLALPGSTLGLGAYASDRYDGYKGSFLRRF